MNFANYAEAESFLLSFVNYEAAKKWPAYNTQHFDLERFASLLEGLGSPHKRPGLIHVAGTKGKGSTCVLLASILSAAGIRTGLYTSPHLVSFCERIRVDGRVILDTDFARLAGDVAGRANAVPNPLENNYRTTFEILTAMAFVFFAEKNCGAAVIETGLGGRLDATNVLAPELTVITALGLDHQHVLGDTLAQIAREKGGIIKPGVPCVVAPQNEAATREALPVLAEVARARGASLIRAEEAVAVAVCEMTEAGERVKWTSHRFSDRRMELTLPLLGAHQVNNLCAALTVVETMEARGWKIGDEAIRRGVATARIEGRCDIVGSDPLFILDGAHCALSMRATVETVQRLWLGRRAIVCFSCLGDKNARDMLAELARLQDLERVIVFPAPSPRACDLAVIRAMAGEFSMPCVARPSAQEAMELAVREATPASLILATGSLYSVGELRRAYEAATEKNPRVQKVQ